MRYFLICLTLTPLSLWAQGPFAPAVGEEGTTAIHADSVIIASWATSLEIDRGWMDAANPDLGEASYGSPDNGTGPADGAVTSLGDGGIATYSLSQPLQNSPGPDFAVFENAFSNFMELAFVEVSSDGEHFVRFPATSLTQTEEQVGGFEPMDPTYIHNFAGKYDTFYGTPFDLQEVADSAGLDIDAITHIRLRDVIGAIGEEFTSYDHEGNAINDPYPTPYDTGGLDLDALALLSGEPSGFPETDANRVKVYPNPAADFVRVSNVPGNSPYRLFDQQGRLVLSGFLNGSIIELGSLKAGLYILEVEGNHHRIVKR